ncbi:protein singed wings 2-like [Drosophila miranda]|uniref:protein singed wings 2-like n=1 Tax=Drosophila miranda TaxID=7229 RepID=UPI00143F7A8B|nr:protein singed wings 2-like [Drosophila miranda]
MRLRELLNQYREIVRDAWNVTCTYMQDDELRLAKVLTLTRQDMCNVRAESGTQIHPIDWLNGVLASLIILILGKLAYDYYHYKLVHVTAADSNETRTTTAIEATPSTTMRMTTGYSQSCFNWTSVPEAAGGNCSRLTRSGLLKCYGGMNNLGSLAKLGKPWVHGVRLRISRNVHLENNRISNVDDLENTLWLQNFRLFNLRGNNLRKLHVYALDNALNDNENANLLLLSKNPWHCTCKFGMRLRELLNQYREIVRDAWNVTCTYMQDDELRLAKVLTLTRQDMCNVRAESGTQIHPIDWLNGVLASLIILILGKLAYDYYHYKYYNRVPWIVMKMP